MQDAVCRNGTAGCSATPQASIIRGGTFGQDYASTLVGCRINFHGLLSLVPSGFDDRCRDVREGMMGLRWSAKYHGEHRLVRPPAVH
jgi:hypothetical protein